MLVLFCHSSVASFKLNRTRIIYGEKEGHELVIQNNYNSFYGGQVWIDNLDDSDEFYFVNSPQFFKVNSGEKQIVRLMKTDATLAEDRESLFWVNVQEIPPKQQSEQSGMVMSFRTRIKLIYRPSDLGERYKAESEVTWKQTGNTLHLNNPTPFYFAITTVSANGEERVPEQKTPLAPFSTMAFTFDSLPALKELTISAINDFGAVGSFRINPTGVKRSSTVEAQ